MSNLLIWDSLEPIPENKKTILWRGFNVSSDNNLVSILDLIEENQESIRKAYLGWSYELAERNVSNISVKDHFEIKPNFSFWWMSAFAEKCNFSKSPQIDNIVKLIGLMQWTDFSNIKSIEVESKNKALIKALHKLSEQRSINFFLYQKTLQLPSIHVPHALKSIAWLTTHLFKIRHLKGAGIDLWRRSSANLTIFSYLANLSNKQLELFEHKSNFWSHLPNKILDGGHNINWLHIFTPSKQISNTKEASKILSYFNKSNTGEAHVFLESFISCKVIIQAIKDWFIIRKIGSKLRNSLVQDDFLLQVMLDDWNKSFYGIDAISNCLNLNLFIAAMGSASNQKLGLYLQENQSWEMGLIYSWRKFNHSEIVGVPHSTTRFWDLRYAHDDRIHEKRSKNCYPKPNYIAVNGEAQKNYFKGIYYPDSELKLVEALRFFHLENKKDSAVSLNDRPSNDSVLILGDYLMENNEQLIEMLKSTAPLLPPSLNFIFKPHPACMIPKSKFKGLNVEINEENIVNLLSRSKIAVSSNVTTAALDAYFHGLPLACMIDPNKLNLSPMLEIDKTVFVKTYKDLVKKISLSISRYQTSDVKPDNFFELNSSLPKWLNFIGSRLDSQTLKKDIV